MPVTPLPLPTELSVKLLSYNPFAPVQKAMGVLNNLSTETDNSGFPSRSKGINP